MKFILQKLILPCTAVLFLHSCKKETNTNKIDPSEKIKLAVREEDPEEIAYDNVIDAVSYGLLDLKNDETFKAIVNGEVEKQFDGDDNVLLLTLNSILEERGRNLEEEMVVSLHNHGRPDLAEYVHPAIHGLEYNKTRIYSQVFIPFIEGKDLFSEVDVICPNKEDDEILPGISLTPDGGLELSDITEDYAVSHLVWVVSINESIDATGSVTDRRSISYGNNNKTTAAGDRFLRIDNIYINEKKEGWGNGRADIAHFTLITRWCSKDNQTQGLPFCKLDNSDLKKWYTPTYKSGYPKILSNVTGQGQAEWEEQYTEDLYTLIFERDIKKKFNNNYNFSNCPNDNTFIYTSKETPYGEIHPRFWDYTGSSSNPSRKIESPKSGADGSFELYGYKL